MKYLVRRFEVDLARGYARAPRAFQQELNLRHVFRREEVAELHGAFDLFFGEQAAQRAIHALDAAIAAERDDTGRNAFENRLGEPAPALELAAVRLELEHHLVEGSHQCSQFVDRQDLNPVPEIALAIDELATRSEEHTSELQSRLHLVCRL